MTSRYPEGPGGEIQTMREMETERFIGAEKEAEARGGGRGWKPP